MFLSVVIPAFNEEKRIIKTLIDTDEYLKGQDFEYEIIVVDDGSSDKTVDIVNSLSSKIPNLRVILNEANHGKGYVVRQGLLFAKGDWRLFMDADSSTSIDQIQKFLPQLNNHDILIGSRAKKGAVVSPAQPEVRKFLGNIAKTLIQAIVGLPKIEDTQCGFKMFSKRSVKNVFPKCKINRWVFDAEILKIAENMGYKIMEVPIVWRNDRNSRVKLTSTIGTIFDLLKIRFNLILGKY